jgi:hypothetical protein
LSENPGFEMDGPHLHEAGKRKIFRKLHLENLKGRIYLQDESKMRG